MKRNGHRFPHTISYRLTDDDYLKVEREIKDTSLTPHDWCREAALERLNPDKGMSRNQRIILNQIARTQYLVSLGFQLIADDKLSSEEWKKLRTYAKQNLELITTKVLSDDPS